MILGVKNGWLDKDEYGPIARRAWLGLCNYLDDNNDLMEVCIGTGKKNSHQYYLDRPALQVIIMDKLPSYGVLMHC